LKLFLPILGIPLGVPTPKANNTHKNYFVAPRGTTTKEVQNIMKI